MWTIERITALRFLSLTALLLSFGIVHPRALRAETEIEITPPPIVIDAQALSRLSRADRDRQTQAEARAWTQTYGSDLKVVYDSAPPMGTGEPDDRFVGRVSDLGATGSDSLNKLVVQVIEFAHNVSSTSTSFAQNFHAQFMHAMSEQAPGFAWVVMAARSGFDLEATDGFRVGGGLGVQIPILGSKDLWLKDDRGQVVLRVLPVAGNYEAVEVGKNSQDRVAAPGSDIVLRPTAEVEGDYQLQHGVHPGIRLLVQPRLFQPNQMRMLAEVYVNVDIQVTGSLLKDVTILPRCMIDSSNDREYVTGPQATLYRAAFRDLNRDATCSISAQFAFQR